MSKIICDVCGTSYPETGTQCPICGCVRSSDSVTVSGDTSEVAIQSPATYTYVKGGRFSKANVKKRNSGKPIYNADPVHRSNDTEKPKKPSNKNKKKEVGLVVTVIVLLIAIAAVVIYIACKFLGISLPVANETKPQVPETTVSSQTGQETTEPSGEDLSCKELTILSDLLIEFNTVGEKYLISLQVMPENTTDEIKYSSNDDQVATVDSNGMITAVGNGNAVITVSCGDFFAKCDVACKIEETEDPTVEPETTTPEVIYTQEDLIFIDNGFGYEYTISLSEGSYNPYIGNIPAELVTFSSNDESVVTVSEDGLVTFVGRGRAVVSVKYEEFVLECVFRII